jgi:hypothetical protein
MSHEKTYPIRWCNGGCNGSHHAHIYNIDPVDGPLKKDYLCPGDLSEAKVILDDDGEETPYGFITNSHLTLTSLPQPIA